MSVGFIHKGEVKDYRIKPPFNPPKDYTELSKFHFKNDPTNIIYDMVRSIFLKLKLDKNHINSSKWNPLSEIIKKDDQVLIKPNLVKHFHPRGHRGILATITHASVLRPIIDYVLLALNGTGRIIIADTPLEKSDFYRIIKLNKTDDLVRFYKKNLKFEIELYDLRSYKLVSSKAGFYSGKSIKLEGPPGGYQKIDIKNESELSELDSHNTNYYTLSDSSINVFEVTRKKKGRTNDFHAINKHIYKIPKIILESDVIISVPKLKTHKMAGVTLNLKNMIGICEKIYIPHHRRGSPPRGDAFRNAPSSIDIVKRKTTHRLNKFTGSIRNIVEKIRNNPLLARSFVPLYENYMNKISITDDWWGAWYGNDTLWRTIFDLNRILLYSNKQGNICKAKQRKYFSIIDGIIGQEGEGPMTGEPKSCGIIIGGSDPAACDTFAAYLMGYDIKRLKIISEINNIKKYKLGNNNLEDFKIFSNIDDPLNVNFKFELPKGYKEISRS